MKLIVFLMVPFTLLSQDLWDNHKKESSVIWTEHKEQSELLRSFYEGDFRDAKKGIDLEALDISLDPEKAMVNTYASSFSAREKMIDEANKYIGVPYVWGATYDKDRAFDCSSLVQWVIKKSYGITVPRTTAMQYDAWGKYMKKNVRNAKPGDLLYFKTRPNTIVSHVAIYLGGGKMLHAPKRNTKVRIQDFEDYSKIFVGYVDIESVIN